MSADYQRHLTAQAPRRAQSRDRELWVASRSRIEAELDLLSGQRFMRELVSDLRVIRRQLERVDDRLRS